MSYGKTSICIIYPSTIDDEVACDIMESGKKMHKGGMLNCGRREEWQEGGRLEWEEGGML